MHFPSHFVLLSAAALLESALALPSQANTRTGVLNARSFVPSPEPRRCTAGNNTIYAPMTWNIATKEPDTVVASRNGINVWNNGDAELGQVVTFSDIPPQAEQCELHWLVQPTDTLMVTGQGSIAVHELLGLPQGEEITWNSVSPLVGRRVGSAAFNGWGKNGLLHLVGSVDCQSTLSFKSVIDGEVLGRVDVLNDSGMSGWALTYECKGEV